MTHIFTIGHSNNSAQEFGALLTKHGIQAIADVRSSPFSRHAPHFNKIELRDFLKSIGVAYVFCDKIDPLDSTKIQTIGLYSHGELVKNISYELKDTPCNNVVGGNYCCYINEIQKYFPQDQLLVDLHAESYAGCIARRHSFGQRR